MADDQDLDDFDLDDDLALPGFDDGDITPPADDRKPVVRAAGGFLNGVKSTALNTNFQRKMIQEALPTGYGKAFDDIQDAASVGRELYDTALENLRPVQRDLKKIGRRLSGKLEGVLPKRIADKIKHWSEDDETASPGEVDWKEAEITSQIGEIFGQHFATQMEMQAEFEERRQEQDAVKTAVEEAKYENQATMLSVIRSGMDRLVAYQDKITAGYQRKMLELQYRQYFLARDQYALFEGYVKETKSQLDDIRKNTGLPDFVKINTSEMARQQMMEKLIGSVRERASDFARGFGQRFKDRLTNQVKDLTARVADGIRGANDALEQTEGVEIDGAEMAGDMIGGAVLDRFGGRAARRLGQLLGKSERVRRWGSVLEYASDNKGELFNTAVTRLRNREVREGPLGLIDRALVGIGELAGQYNAGYNPTDTFGVDPTKLAEEGVPYTALTDKSITEVIPGLLTEILRETEMIRTGGDNAERKIYDFETGTIKRQGEVEQKLLDRVFNKGTVEMIREDLNRLADEVIGKRKVSPEARIALIKQLMSMASQGRGFNPIALATPGGITSTTDWNVIDEVRNLIIDRYMSDGKLRMDDESAMKSLNKASSHFSSIRDAIPNHQEAVRRLMPVYGVERLERAGLITSDAELSDEEIKEISTKIMEIRDKLKNPRLPNAEREKLQKEMATLTAKLKTGQLRTNTGGILDYLTTGKDPMVREAFDGDLKTRSFGERLRESAKEPTAKDMEIPPFGEDLTYNIDEITAQLDTVLRELGDRLDPHAKLDAANTWLEKIYNLLAGQGPGGGGGGPGGGGPDGGTGGGPQGPGPYDISGSRWLKNFDPRQYSFSRWLSQAKDKGSNLASKLKDFDFNDAKDSALLHAMYGMDKVKAKTKDFGETAAIHGLYGLDAVEGFLREQGLIDKMGRIKGKAKKTAQKAQNRLRQLDKGRTQEALEFLRTQYASIQEQLPGLKGKVRDQAEELLYQLEAYGRRFAQQAPEMLDDWRNKTKGRYDDLIKQIPELKDKVKDFGETAVLHGMYAMDAVKDNASKLKDFDFNDVKDSALLNVMYGIDKAKDKTKDFGETAVLHGMYAMDKVKTGVGKLKEKLPESMEELQAQVMELVQASAANGKNLESLSNVLGVMRAQSQGLGGRFKEQVGKAGSKVGEVVNLQKYRDQIEAKRSQLGGSLDEVMQSLRQVVGSDLVISMPDGRDFFDSLDFKKFSKLKLTGNLNKDKSAANDPHFRQTFLERLKGLPSGMHTLLPSLMEKGDATKSTIMDALGGYLPQVQERAQGLRATLNDKLAYGKAGLAEKLSLFRDNKDKVLDKLSAMFEKGSTDASSLGGGDYWDRARELMKELFQHLDEKTEMITQAILASGTGGEESSSFWKKTLTGAGAGLGAAAKGIGKFYGGLWRGVGKALPGIGRGIGAATKGLGSGIKGLLQNGHAATDLYLKGQKEPIILLRDLKAGKYLDYDTGEVITSVKDIKGPLVDEDGNIVLSREDLQDGRVVNVYGKSPFAAGGGALNMIGRGIGAYLKGAGKFYGLAGKGVAGILGVAKDVVEDLLLSDVPRDIYVQGETKPRLYAYKLKNGGYYSKETGKPITSIKDIDGDVIDEEGNVLLSADDIEKGLVDSRGRKLRAIAGLVGKLAKGTWKGYKAYLGFLGKMGKGAWNMLTGKFQFGSEDAEVGVALLDESKKHTTLLEEIKKLLAEGGSKKRVLGDTDGDGIREGSWQERLGKGGREIVKDDRTHDFKDRTKDSLLNAGGGPSGWLDKAKDFLGFGDGPDLPDRNGRKSRKPKGGRFMRGLKTLARGGAFLGKGALALGKGALTLGKGALALGKGAAMLAGGVLSAPVLLTAAAVTAVGVVGYLAYKHLYKKPKGPIHAVRLIQYGFNPDDKDALSKMAALEKAVESEAKFGTDNTASFSGNLDPAKLLEAVGINAEDEEGAMRFAAWFKARFSPVYLSHLAVAKRLAGGVALMEVDDKLDASQKLEYIKSVSFPTDGSGPYAHLESPFDRSTSLLSATAVKQMIDSHIAKLVKAGGAVKDETPTPVQPEAPVEVKKLQSTAEALASMAPDMQAANDPSLPTGEPPTLNHAFNEMAGDEVSADRMESQRAKRERTLAQVQSQAAQSTSELASTMARVEDVLSRSYAVQVSMDKSLKEIWNYFKEKKEAEEAEEGWSLFGGPSKSNRRPTPPAPPRQSIQPPPPAVDMKRS